MVHNITASEAKANLAEWLRIAQRGDPVVITRHGHAVAALVPAEDLDQLARLRAAGPEAGLIGLVGGWEGSEELVQRLAEQRRSSPRSATDLD